MMAAGGGFAADGRPIRMDPLAALIQFATPYSNNPSTNVSANNSDHDSEDDLDQPSARTGKAGGTPGTAGLKNGPQSVYGGQQNHGMAGWGPTLGGAPWHAAMQAKRALITDDAAHSQGPAVTQAAPMPGMMPNWGYPPTDPDAAAAAGWSPEQVQQFWAMQQQLAQMQGRGYANAARAGERGMDVSEPTSSDEASSVASTPQGDKRYRRSSIVGGAAVLAAMSSRQYNRSKAAATISPINESAPTETAAAAKAPSNSRGARKSVARGGSATRRSSAKSSSAKATERETARASTSSPAAGPGLAGKNSRAKETHRQAEQRRRGEQIKAVMELKTELNLHDGTPLGETLIHAADHIKALQESERRLSAELDRLRKKRR